MSLLTLMAVLLAVAVLMYLINYYVPPRFRQIFRVAVAIAVILWLIRVFGLLDYIAGVHVGR